MLNLKKKNKEETKLHAQKQQEKKTVLRGRIKPQGQDHNLYKQNIQTGEIEMVQKNAEKYDLHWFDALKGTYKSKYGRVEYEKGYRYCTALNEKNAEKRFNKMKQEGLTFKS